MWGFEYFKTDPITAEISGETSLTSIIRNFTFDETVGDEMIIKSGDLSLTMDAPLPFDEDYYNWIAAYWNGELFNVYYLGFATYNYSFLEYNHKDKFYKTRIEPIQKLFYEHLSDTLVQSEITTRKWGYGLNNSMVIIDQIRIDNIAAPSFILNRWGYSLGDMLINLKSSGTKTNERGYYISDYTMPTDIKFKNNDDLPLLFRGLSDDSGVSYLTAINNTFKNHNVYWMDIFKIALLAFNCYLKVTPAIISGKLAVEFHLIPKIYISGSGTAAEWTERKKETAKYRVDGLILRGTNFEFTQGNFKSSNRIEKDIGVGDPEAQIGVDDTNLYWAAGDYLSGSGKYDILDASEQNEGYFELGLVQPYYQDMIDIGDGYNGEIRYNGEAVLSLIALAETGETIMVNQLSINDNGFAKVEGVVI